MARKTTETKVPTGGYVLFLSIEELELLQNAFAFFEDEIEAPNAPAFLLRSRTNEKLANAKWIPND